MMNLFFITYILFLSKRLFYPINNVSNVIANSKFNNKIIQNNDNDILLKLNNTEPYKTDDMNLNRKKMMVQSSYFKNIYYTNKFLQVLDKVNNQLNILLDEMQSTDNQYYEIDEQHHKNIELIQLLHITCGKFKMFIAKQEQKLIHNYHNFKSSHDLDTSNIKDDNQNE